LAGTLYGVFGNAYPHCPALIWLARQSLFKEALIYLKNLISSTKRFLQGCVLNGEFKRWRQAVMCITDNALPSMKIQHTLKVFAGAGAS
jgi:hypothetical protein